MNNIYKFDERGKLSEGTIDFSDPAKQTDIMVLRALDWCDTVEEAFEKFRAKSNFRLSYLGKEKSRIDANITSTYNSLAMAELNLSLTKPKPEL